MKLLKTVAFLLCVMPLITMAQKPYIKNGEPGAEKRWRIVWKDNFINKKTIDENWIAENKAPSHIISSRWRENVCVRRGKLVLNNRREQREGKEWTTGSITCKRKFKYGYYECRLKLSDASGINNSFWLYNWSKTDEKHAFEIDILEGHYPNEINTTIHDRGSRKKSGTKSVTNIVKNEVGLTHKYHRYGLWWSEEILRFYFDGRLIWEVPNNYCHQEANLVLGTAVIKWAGAVTEAIDGTSMVVDYVRIWKEKN